MDLGMPAGAIGGIFPPTNRYGVARSDSGVASNLATGVLLPPERRLAATFGIGVFGLVGGGVNYRRQHTTPILAPRQPPELFRGRPHLLEHIASLRSCQRRRSR